MSDLLSKAKSSLFRRRRHEKKRSTHGTSPSKEGFEASKSLAPKRQNLERPASASDDLWVQAERKLRQNSELDKIMTASVEILRSEYNLRFQPGDSCLHERLSEFLETKATQVEEKKWVINLGTHAIIVRDQLTKVFQNLLAVKDIVTTAANASLAASLACAGIMACFTTVIQAAEQHSHLLQGLESISDLICRLHVMERLYLHSSTEQDISLLDNLRKSIISFYTKILEFQARALCYLHKPRASRFWRDVLNRDGWTNLLQEFERYQKTIGRTTCVIADAESRQRHEELQNEYKKILEALRDRDTWTTTSDRDKQVKRFLNLLYTCPYKDRKDRNNKRVPGTCEWFIGHNKFHAWQGSSGDDLSGLLWVSADPGCGKSVLTRYLVDEVLVSNDKRTVCYFFFKDDFADQKSATSALSVILRQLFIAQPHLLHDAILDKVDTDGDQLIQSFSELWNILMAVSTNPKADEIICLIDALDECQDEDRNRLINAVNDFYSGPHDNSKLKFLITSRPYEHIRRGLSDLITILPTIHLSGDGEREAEQISQEINHVISTRVHDISRQRSLTDGECEMLIHKLTAVSNRTYLWVSLILDVLENIPEFSKGKVHRILSDLPTTVDSAYEKILDRSPDKEKAKTLLHIITAAMRPLSLDELSLGLALSAGYQDSTDIADNMEPAYRFRKTLRDLCGLFVIILDDKAYLLHQTAKEFLVQDSNSTPDTTLSQSTTTWKNSLHPGESNRILAEICIFCISLESDDPSQGCMLEYSSCYWATHFRQACIPDEDPLLDRAKSLCEPRSGIFQSWSGIHAVKADNVPDSTSTLLIASSMGLIGVVKSILSTGKEALNSKDSEYDQTPLLWAAERGHAAVVRLLLAADEVDIDSRNSVGRSPLSLAAQNGHHAVVKLLIQENIDIDLKDMAGSTPLALAAENGHEGIVRLLLATGKADIDSSDSSGIRPLSLAAQFGQEAVVKLLLASEQVDVNSKDSRLRTPIYWAARGGCEAIVRRLLDTGKIEVDCKDSDNGTPLLMAAINGYEGIVKRLLATGEVDVNVRDESHGMSSLSWAAWAGHDAVVELLLATGEVNVNTRDQRYGRSPLSLAAKEGHEKVAKLLLATGKADVDSRCIRGRTPLSWAAWEGHDTVVKLLLATEGVGVNCRDSEDRTPLSLAAETGKEAVIRLLIATGKADVNAKDATGRTPLDWAAEKDHQVVVKLLQSANE
ncbi:hypothetical protein AtubIFM55763_005606 [Aspergillus tubingensis]|uniref:Unnamed protein product n=1 Tax=Aspergillus niger TaxID=5061 RepID=A0A124BY99_ASPNG|nr:ankyrin repeat domain-containing protein 50 [Aspergillus tubingensis]GAQ44901.1 unnamed protein product [Aspergillus niger]GFN11849.1 ankyrin repeat domain-containing protein 50 [Aspergillus tubingensis]GLA67093.1 hypothetical protein AtubIFM54640_010069 [Aspergillus tubingensis]GLA74365.1 hypothetical protein AtubIFM55763_005606 [Aspergillus tubingensis]